MIQDQLKHLIQQAVEKTTGQKDLPIALEIPQDTTHGDYSTNIAMQLAKNLKQNPKDLAEKIQKDIANEPGSQLLITDSSVAGPGFINFTIADEAWKQEFQSIISELDTFGRLDLGKGKTAITDTSHPNVAKPMLVHNTLSTIIGATINNLLSNAGYKVIRDNYIGDWGTQYGKLNYAIKKWGDMEKIKLDPIPELLKLYIKVHDESEKDPSIEDEGRKEFKKMEEGNKENLELWKWARELSMKEFMKGYERLGIDFDLINGESFYEPMMNAIVDEGVIKGVIIEGERGALIIPMDDENKPPAIIKKSDGSSLYATRDLARIKYWQDDLKGDIGINVVDIAQKLYFEQLFESATKMGYTKMAHTHVEFGRMSFPDSSMSTRKGNVVLFGELLDEAEKRALKIIKEHGSELPEEEQKELARKIGIGAVKYHILSQSRLKNYTFSWDTMLTFDGNSAPYLQYAYARTQSLLRKDEDKSVIASEAKLKIRRGGQPRQSKHKQSLRTTPLTPSEKDLIKNFTRLPEVLASSTEEYKPNILCTYLFELSQSFSAFYNDSPILKAENTGEKEFRLEMTKVFAHILKKGLSLLGIEVPNRM